MPSDAAYFILTTLLPLLVVAFASGYMVRDCTAHKELMDLYDKVFIIIGHAQFWRDEAMKCRRQLENDGEEWKLGREEAE